MLGLDNLKKNLTNDSKNITSLISILILANIFLSTFYDVIFFGNLEINVYEIPYTFIDYISTSIRLIPTFFFILTFLLFGFWCIDKLLKLDEELENIESESNVIQTEKETLNNDFVKFKNDEDVDPLKITENAINLDKKLTTIKEKIDAFRNKRKYTIIISLVIVLFLIIAPSFIIYKFIMNTKLLLILAAIIFINLYFTQKYEFNAGGIGQIKIASIFYYMVIIIYLTGLYHSHKLINSNNDRIYEVIDQDDTILKENILIRSMEKGLLFYNKDNEGFGFISHDNIKQINYKKNNMRGKHAKKSTR